MTTAEQLFSNLEFLYENIYNLLIGFQQANNGINDIEVTLKKKSTTEIGKFTTEKIKIKSFENILSEINRLQSNFNSLTNTDNISYVLNGDGSLSQVTKTSFISAEYLYGFKDYLSQETCITDDNNFIRNMLFPNVKIPVELSNKLNSDIHCRIFEIKDGWENVLSIKNDDLTILQLKYLKDNGLIVADDYSIELKPELTHIKYFGKFSIIEIINSKTTEYELVLDNVKYEGVNTYGIILDLKVNDILVTKDGTAKYIITDINLLTKNVKIKQIAGQRE